MKKTILMAGLALSLLGGVAANAQPGYGNDNRDNRGQQQQRQNDRRDGQDQRGPDQRGQDQRGQDQRGQDQRGQDWRGQAQQDRQDLRQDQRQFQRAQKRYRMQGRYTAPRGYANHNWRYGERLPSGYGGRYAINDYNRYGLYAPPRGYQWQRVGNDAVLVAITSGLIGAAISQLFN